MNICSVLCPRPDHPRWMDYTPLLRALQFSCDRLGLRHVVMTDDPALPGGFETFCRPTPHNLMATFGLLYALWCEEGDWRGQDTLFTGADCLILRDPALGMPGSYDMAVTWRNRARPINTGAVLVRESARVAAGKFWRGVSERTGEEWGADLDAIAAALMPIPLRPGRVEERAGMRVAWFDQDAVMRKPMGVDDTMRGATVAHFKGRAYKLAMLPWAARHLGYGDGGVAPDVMARIRAAYEAKAAASSHIDTPAVPPDNE